MKTDQPRRSLRAFPLLASLVLGLTAITTSAAPLQLHVDGNKVKDSNGNIVRLQGANIPSLEWKNEGENIVNSQTHLRDVWKANFIRFPLSQDRWFGYAPGQTDGGAAYRAIVDGIVSRANAGNYYVLLDLHWSNRGVWGSYLGQAHMPDMNSATFWSDCANRYKNHPAVLFDLYNEPYLGNWEIWRNGGQVTTGGVTYQSPGMQGLLNAVRNTGANNVVVVGGIAFGYDLTGVMNGYALTDTASGRGIIYSSHVYPWKTDRDSKVAIAAMAHPILIGECGADDDQTPEGGGTPLDAQGVITWSNNHIAWMNAHGFHWTGWSFHKGAGPKMISDWVDYTPTPWGQVAKNQIMTATLPPQTVTVLGHYSFNNTSGLIANRGGAGTTLDLTNTGGVTGRDNTGAGGYGATAYPGYGKAFNVLASGDGTYHSGAGGSPTGGGLVTAGAVPQSSLQGANGAFTYEAFVSLATTTGEQTILSHDGSNTRGFHFHLNGNQLRLYTGATTLTAPIPTTGAHAFTANEWFHVAVTYNGQEGAAGNLRFYWTALDAPVTEANLVGTATLSADLAPSVNNVLGVGTTTRSAFRYELRGLVDEVRLSNTAVAPAGFAFANVPAPTVQLTGSDAWEQTSFTSGARWSDLLAPHAGPTYVVAGLDLRTPGNTSSHTFGGDAVLLIDGGRLVMRTPSPGVVTVSSLYSSDGYISLGVNGAHTLAGSLTLQTSGLSVSSGSSGRTLTIASQINGAGGLTVSMGSATDHVTLTQAANTYTGGTVVTAGTVRAHADGALGLGNITVANGATLRLASGSTHNYIANAASLVVGGTATVNLAFTGTDTVNRLSLNGGTSYVTPGQWGAVGSGAANTSARLTGTGRLQVTSN